MEKTNCAPTMRMPWRMNRDEGLRKGYPGGRKKRFVLLAVVLSASIFLLAYFQPAITGFFGAGEGGKTETRALREEAAAPANDTAIKPEISFEVVGNTKLEVRGSPLRIAACPETTAVRFIVENAGTAQAERLFVSAQGIEIKSCRNCDLRKIGAGKSAAIDAELCGTSSLRWAVGFGSLNSDTVEFLFVH